MQKTESNEHAIIGIAGSSGSGKSELAAALAAHFGRATVLPLDAYYHCLATVPVHERGLRNFDHPDALDWPMIREHVGALAASRAVNVPVYDFASHTRRGTHVVEAGGVIVIEGILALFDRFVREHLDVSVFVETPESECLERRVLRDQAERGRTRDDILRQFESTVAPMTRAYVLPTAAYADVRVDGTQPISLSVAAVLGALDANRALRSSSLP